MKRINVLLIVVCACLFGSQQNVSAADASLNDFSIVYQQNIFSRDRRPPSRQRVQQPPVRRATRTVVLSIYMLKGIANDGNIKTAFVEEEVSGSTMRLSVSDEILEGQIIAIGSDYVLFKQDGIAKKIKIGEQFGRSENVSTFETGSEPDTSSYGSNSSSSGSDEAVSGDEDEILKKMLERRQQQLGG